MLSVETSTLQQFNPHSVHNLPHFTCILYLISAIAIDPQIHSSFVLSFRWPLNRPKQSSFYLPPRHTHEIVISDMLSYINRVKIGTSVRSRPVARKSTQIRWRHDLRNPRPGRPILAIESSCDDTGMSFYYDKSLQLSIRRPHCPHLS